MQNEHDALDTVGDYECPAGMSVEDGVPVVVNMNTLKHDRLVLVLLASPKKDKLWHGSLPYYTFRQYSFTKSLFVHSNED